MSLQKHPEQVDTDDLPIIIESGGSTAGEKYVAIESGECGHCGYDRVKVTRQYGETFQQCLLCDARGHGGDWTTPRSDSDELRSLRKYAEKEQSPVVKHGQRKASRYRKTMEVFGYENANLVKWFTYNPTEYHSISHEELNQLLTVLEQSEGFVTEFVDEHLDGKQVRPSVGNRNPNAVHIGRLAYDGGPDRRTMMGLHTSSDHQFDWNVTIHIPATMDGVAV